MAMAVDPQLTDTYALSPAGQAVLRELHAAGIGEALAEWRNQMVARGQQVGVDDQRAKAESLLHQRLRQVNERHLANGIARLVPAEETAVVQAAIDDMFGAGHILERLLADERVENIDANGCDDVWIGYDDGSVVPGPPLWSSDDKMIEHLQRLARLGATERRFDSTTARLLLQLDSGARLHALRSVSDRPSMSVRRHRLTDVTLADLQRLGMFDNFLGEFLSAAVQARLNIVVGGPMNAGKTTFQLGLLNEVDPYERIVTIEDVKELGLKRLSHRHHNVVELEAREANTEGLGEYTMAQLVKDALKMNVGRLVVGEVRGGEIFHMLNAMSAGGDGSICTLHARSSLNIFDKITTYLALAEEQISETASARMIGETIDLAIYVSLRRTPEGLRRRVASVRAVTGSEAGQVQTVELFRPDDQGRATWGNVPLRPDMAEKLADVGWDIRRLRGVTQLAGADR